MLQVGDVAPAFRVQPVFGLPVQTGGRPLVVAFVRPLEGSIARAALHALQAAFPRFDAEGIGVVAFTRCDLTLARDWVPRHHLLLPLVIDDEGRWFDAYGVHRDRALLRSIAGLRPSGLVAAGRALGEGRNWPAGGGDQLPAEFVVGADGRIRYAHYGRSVLDQPDVEALWAAATGT